MRRACLQNYGNWHASLAMTRIEANISLEQSLVQYFMMKSPLFALLLLCIAKFDFAEAFATQKSHLQHHNSKTAGRISSLSATEEKNTDKEDKFSFQQRIESVKTAAVGAISVSCWQGCYDVFHPQHHDIVLATCFF